VDILDFTTLVSSLGFPIACCIALGLYIRDINKRQAEERKQEREDEKADKERLYKIIEEANKTNATLLETNKKIAEELKCEIGNVGFKVDNVLKVVSER
jgi:enterochelin esterase-like enzyme